MKIKLIILNIAKMSILFVLAIFYLSCSSNRPNSLIESFYNYPNPFNNRTTSTTFIVLLKEGEIISATLDIYSQSGDLVDSKSLIITDSNKREATCVWSGLDKNGKYLPPSLYTSKLTLKDNKDATYIEEFKTLIN